jgi:uncharacterized lipoprotein YajG
MKTRVLATIIQAGVLLVLCAACATTDPLVVDFSTATTRESQDTIEECAVKVATVMDERKSREDLGVLGAHVVEGRHVIPWLQRAVESLNSVDAELIGRKGDPENTRSLAVQVGLTQLYVHPLQSSFAANILLKAQYRVDQGPPRAHQYRGADTNVNWTGSASSVLSLFDDVLGDVLRRMRTDIKQLCQGTEGM